MLVKLALRNVRRSAREYLIYFITLVLGVSVFYAFNALDDSSILFKVKADSAGLVTSGGVDVFGLIAQLMAVFSVVVAVVLGLLILYANRFVVRARQREFGTYLLLGMTVPQVCAIVLMETLLVGVISLACGLFLGIGISQGLSFATAALLEMSISNYQIIFSAGSALTTLSTFAAIFLAVAVFNALQIGRSRIITLLNSHSTNERMPLRRPIFCVVGFTLAIAILALAYHSLATCNMNLMSDEFFCATILMLVGTLILFWSGSSFIALVLSHTDAIYLRGLRMFTVRQVTHKANTAFVSLWAVCVLLFFTLTTFSCGTGLASLFSGNLSKAAPYDASFTGIPLSDADSPSNQLYLENDGDSIAYLQKYCPSWKTSVESAAQLDFWSVDNTTYADLAASLSDASNASMDAFFQSTNVQFISISQYNNLARLTNAQTIDLADDEYAVCNNVDNTAGFSQALALSTHGINLFGTHLKASGTLVETQLIDDSLVSTTTVLVVPHNMVHSAREQGLRPDSCIVNVMYRSGLPQATTTEQLRNECSQSSGLVTVWPISYDVNPESIRNDTLAFKLTVTYLGLYISFVFLVTTAAVLSVQQLSEVAESIGRYRMLARLGCDRRTLMASLRSQMIAYFAAPLVVALCHAAYAVSVMYTNVLSLAGVDPLVLVGATGLVMGIYLLYLVCTYQVAKGAIISGQQ